MNSKLQEALTEITSIKAETKTHLQYIGDCGKGRIRKRLEKRIKHLDNLKSLIHSVSIANRKIPIKVNLAENKNSSINS